MTAVFKPMSFSLCDENREYILAKVAEGKKKSKTYKASHYLQELITHLREKSSNTFVTTVEVIKPKVKRFKPPTVEEVRKYCDSRCNNVDANAFVAHYETANWKRGNTKISNWKACVHTWESKNKPAVNKSLKGKW